MYVHVYEVLSI